MKKRFFVLSAALFFSGSAFANGPVLNCEGYTASGHAVKVRVVPGAFHKMVANVYHDGYQSNFLKRCDYGAPGFLYQCLEDAGSNPRSLDVYRNLRAVYHGSQDDTELNCRYMRSTAE